MSQLAIARIHEFSIKSIDLVPAFPLDELDVVACMDIPLGMVVRVNREEWVLKLNKALYGLKRASANWFDLLKTVLERRGYHQYQVNPCIFYRKDSVVLTYVDDSVIVSHK